MVEQRDSAFIYLYRLRAALWLRKSYQFQSLPETLRCNRGAVETWSWVTERQNKQNYQFVVVIFKLNTQENNLCTRENHDRMTSTIDNCQHLRQWTCGWKVGWKMANMSTMCCAGVVRQRHISLDIGMQIANRSISCNLYWLFGCSRRKMMIPTESWRWAHCERVWKLSSVESRKTFIQFAQKKK